MRYTNVLLSTALASRYVAIASPISSQPQSNETIPVPPAHLPAPVGNLSVITFDDNLSAEYLSPGSKILSKTSYPANNLTYQIASTNLTKRDLNDIESTKLDFKRDNLDPTSFCGPGYVLYTSRCASIDVVEVICYPQTYGHSIIHFHVSCTADVGGANNPNAPTFSVYYCVENLRPEPFTRARCIFQEIVRRWTTPTEGYTTGYAGIAPVPQGPAPGKYLSLAATVLYDTNGYGVSVDSLGFFTYDPQYQDMGTCNHTEFCLSSTVDWTERSAWAWVAAGATGGLTAISYIMEDVGF